MTVDVLQVGAVCGAVASVLGVWGLIVSPFKNAIKRNDETMRSLQDTIRELSFELKESQKDRESIHKQLEKHEDRIGKTEDDIIINNERIATLFKSRKD